jgi:hypothetical protein
LSPKLRNKVNTREDALSRIDVVEHAKYNGGGGVRAGGGRYIVSTLGCDGEPLMIGVQPRRIRLDQCEASITIRARFGLRSAFYYLVLEKLMNFAEAAKRHPEFARELPSFVVSVRSLFTISELRAEFARLELEPAQPEFDTIMTNPDLEEGDVFVESPEVVLDQAARLEIIKELLLADQLGIS